MPERDIRKALKKRVESYGGEIRALAWNGRRNAPDVVCMFYDLKAAPGISLHPLVETKAPNGVPTIGQRREHERLRKAGFEVEVISTFEQLDDWLPPK